MIIMLILIKPIQLFLTGLFYEYAFKYFHFYVNNYDFSILSIFCFFNSILFI